MSAYDLHPDDPGFKFRPCPFCGSSDIVKAPRFGIGVTTSCRDCEAEGPIRITGREADAAWNKREVRP